jgi:hypothetical protein
LRSKAVFRQVSAASELPNRLCKRPIMKCTAASRGTMSCNDTPSPADAPSPHQCLLPQSWPAPGHPQTHTRINTYVPHQQPPSPPITPQTSQYINELQTKMRTQATSNHACLQHVVMYKK